MVLAFGGEQRARLGVGPQERLVDLPPHAGIADDQEVPRLHVTDRGRPRRRPQEALDDLLRQGARAEAAHVAALADGPVDRGPFGFRECVGVVHVR